MKDCELPISNIGKLRVLFSKISQLCFVACAKIRKFVAHAMSCAYTRIMKTQHIRLFLFGLLMALGLGTATAQYSPTNPPEPQIDVVTYPVSVTCSPAEAGYASGTGRYSLGQTVRISTSARSGFVFDHWTLNGEPYTPGTTSGSGQTPTSFYYKTADQKMQFVAHYRYQPTNPSEPSPADVARLYLASSPEGVASFNRTSGARETIGSKVSVDVFPNQGYKFVGWYVGEELVSDVQSFSYTMPDNNVTLVARFVYSPDRPIDPETSPDQPDVDLTPDDGIPGDVNGDDEVDQRDLRYLVKIVLGQQDENESADVDRNRRISISDVTALIELLKTKK